MAAGIEAAGVARILVIEDEPAIVELILFSLRSRGWQAASASTAGEGWESIRQQTPDLVLLDWMLPDQSGIGLLSRIRGSRQYQSLPVIMLTAKSSEKNRIEGLRRGADDYVSKPFSPHELCNRIDALLQRKK